MNTQLQVESCKLQVGRPAGAEQISNLPYRRFPIGNRPAEKRHRVLAERVLVLPAGWKPAVQQIKNLRYIEAPDISTFNFQPSTFNPHA
jgi:hypothetical protein